MFNKAPPPRPQRRERRPRSSALALSVLTAALLTAPLGCQRAPQRDAAPQADPPLPATDPPPPPTTPSGTSAKRRTPPDRSATPPPPGASRRTIPPTPSQRAPQQARGRRFSAAWSPFHVEADATHVYWNQGDGKLWRRPKAGGPRELLRKQWSIAFDLAGDDLYFSSKDGIYRMPKVGGAPTRIVAAQRPLDVLVTRRYLLFDAQGALYRAPRAGGKATLLWRGRRIGTFVRQGPDVFLSDYKGNAVWRVPVRGGTPVLLGRITRPVALTAHGKYVYVCAERDGTVRRLPKRPGGKVEVVARGQRNHEVMRAEDGGIYWRNWAGARGHHTLMRYDVTSGKVSVAAGGLTEPSGYAFDARYVYIANKGRDEILRVRRRPPAAVP